ILPIPDTVRISSGMAMYVPLAGKDKKYQFLAKMQGTCKPVLPIHTTAEKQLFCQLITSNSSFSPISGELKWQEAVKIWNSASDQTAEIYYKLTEQLKVYYTKWKALSHVKETLSITADVRRPLSLLIHDPHHSTMAPEVPVHTQPPLIVEKGLLGFSPTPDAQSQTGMSYLP
ncbi:hypothetical protein K443DRAFT_99931, partial [Laccaria amethystina LaAM-08-1]